MKPLSVILGVCLLSVTSCVCALILSVRTAVDALPSQLTAARADIRLEIEGLRDASLQEIDRQASGLRHDLNGQLSDFRGQLDGQITGIRSDLTQTVSTSVQTAIAPVQGLRADLAPTLANLQGITEHANEASSVLFRRDALPAQLLGVLGGAKVTLGQTALTMRTFQEATPGLLNGLNQVVENSNQTTQHTNQVMANLAVATKPLPKWLRIPLAVTGAFAPTIAGAVSTAAATGAFK